MKDNCVRTEKGYEFLTELLSERGIDIEQVKESVRKFEVEIPTWVFGAFGGGRFGDFLPPGAAPDSWAKLKDAAMVNKLTGACSRIAMHLAWDKPQDVEFEDIRPHHFKELAAFAQELGLELGAVNPTLFLSGTHNGSFSSPDPSVRSLMIEHSKVACEVAAEHANNLVTYWLPDGSLYPGHRDLWEQEKMVRDALTEIYESAPSSVTHLIEYKLFEPGTYSTVISDWGVALDIARSLGDCAGVLIDMGHHAWGVNVPQIVARLIGTGVKGGFHFNSRYAADDDHAVEPDREMYNIFCELTAGDVINCADPERNWSYMVDQCSAMENRIASVIHTVDSLQMLYAKALVLDRPRLKEMQEAGDIMRANRVFLDAFLTDVRPILETMRREQGLPADPVAEFYRSGYQQQIERERV